jgi:hypothetical protein
LSVTAARLAVRFGVEVDLARMIHELVGGPKKRLPGGPDRRASLLRSRATRHDPQPPKGDFVSCRSGVFAGETRSLSAPGGDSIHPAAIDLPGAFCVIDSVARFRQSNGETNLLNSPKLSTTIDV